MTTTVTTQITDALTNAAAKLHLRADDSVLQKSLDVPEEKEYKYAKFLPSYDQNMRLPPLEPFDHVDPGHAALNDPNPRAFLEGGKETKLTPKFGSEVEGIQLSKLDAQGKRSVPRL
jgi:sulfonate dioxygenase